MAVRYYSIIKDGALVVGVRLDADQLEEIIPSHVMLYEDDELDAYCYAVQARLAAKIQEKNSGKNRRVVK